jgi:hypothetical protein
MSLCELLLNILPSLLLVSTLLSGEAAADMFACGDPVEPEGITSGDALRVLRTGVGTAECDDCICDVDASGSIAASDALAVLRKAVGQQVELECPPCECAELGEQCQVNADCCEIIVPPPIVGGGLVLGAGHGTCCAGTCQSFGICLAPESSCGCDAICCSGSCGQTVPGECD